MPKAIKGNTGRKPPEPSVNHSDIDDWCRRLMPDLQPIVKRLDESIRATVQALNTPSSGKGGITDYQHWGGSLN